MAWRRGTVRLPNRNYSNDATKWTASMTPIAKTCTKCGETKALEEFSKDKSRKDGLKSRCKACSNAIDAARYKANRDKANAQSAASTRMTKPTKEN
jgi:hypothetical protein